MVRTRRRLGKEHKRITPADLPKCQRPKCKNSITPWPYVLTLDGVIMRFPLTRRDEKGAVLLCDACAHHMLKFKGVVKVDLPVDKDDEFNF